MPRLGGLLVRFDRQLQVVTENGDAGARRDDGESDPSSRVVTPKMRSWSSRGGGPYLRRELGWPLNELAMERWCETNAVGSLHGRCRVHRAEILRLRGSCNEAGASGPRRRGHGGGVNARRPGASRAGALERATTEHRPAASAAARGAGRDRDRGRRHHPGSIGRRRAGLIAARFESKALVASAALARGRVRLADGDVPGAEQPFSEAVRLWNEVGAPYEAALARIGLAEAHRAGGNEHRAALERHAARTILEGIEAEPTVAPTYVEHHDALGEQPAGSFNAFRHEGDYWSVIFEGHTVRVRDLKGMRYLARLLADPGREYHVLDLVAGETGRVAKVDSSQAADLPRSGLGDAGEMLDARAKDAYRRRLVEIEDDIDQARAIGDAERAAQAEAERDFLVRELTRAVGLGRRDRRAASASERARVGVTRAIRQAITRIGEHHPELHEHLNRTIRTGTYCAYVPDTRAPAAWQF
jgi:hypothetical protein